MYRCVTNITITQQPTVSFPNRKTVLNFDFVNDFEWTDSWRDFTNKGKLVLPKNLYFRDQYNKLKPLHGTNINVGGFSSNAPLFLRGDRVTIDAGYKYFNSAGREVTDTATVLTGFISKVHSKIPIEMEIEDNMWLLKQTPMDRVTFAKTDTLEKVLLTLVNKVNAVHGTSFTVNTTTSTTVGRSFAIGNEQAVQVLQTLRKLYGFESYFRGDELRSGVLVYLPADNLDAFGKMVTPNIFAFQQNIIDDELEYIRKDDVNLSAVAHNTIEEETGQVTKDGQKKKKHTRLEVLLTIRNNPAPNDIPYTYKVIDKQNPVAENTDGERHTFFFPGAQTVAELADMAYQKLRMYYYTGFRGKFTTFGIPFTREGDNVQIQDPVLPERAGTYRVKAVEYTGGVGGLRQVVSLDFKLNTN